MRDKRPVDELSVADLERILVVRKRQERQERLRRFGAQGRRLPAVPDELAEAEPPPLEQHEAAEAVPPVEPPVTYDITGDVPRFEDELEAEFEQRRKKDAPKRPSQPTPPHGLRPPRRREAWDKLLLTVEVLAVIGVVAVLIGGGYLIITENDKIEALEQKSADIQRDAEAMRATPTPMPVLSVNLSDYVLPGGHYSPDMTGGIGTFNVDEVPESIRPLAMAQLSAPQAERVTQQPGSPVRIVINTSRVKVDASVYGGDDPFTLQRGVGHNLGSANPGEDANMVLSAHNDVWGEIFRDIQYLEPGDEIRIQTNNNRWYTYDVFKKDIVGPTDVWVMARGNEPIVTLITCHPYRVDTRRMIVFARLREDT